MPRTVEVATTYNKKYYDFSMMSAGTSVLGYADNDINKTAKDSFKKVIKYKPLSSRKESKEIYIYCKGL